MKRAVNFSCLTMCRRIIACTVVLLLLFSLCSCSGKTTATDIIIDGTRYSLELPNESDLRFEAGRLSMTLRDTSDVKLDLSVLDRCNAVEILEIISLAKADIILPGTPSLDAVTVNCKNIGSIDCSLFTADQNIVIRGNIGRIISKQPVSVQFEGPTDLGQVVCEAGFAYLSLDTVCDLSPLSGLKVRRLVISGEGWDLNQLRGNRSVSDLVIHNWSSPDFSFLEETEVVNLDIGICADISSLSVKQLGSLIVRDDCLDDISPIQELEKLNTLIIWSQSGTGEVISSDNAERIDAADIHLDKNVIKAFIAGGGTVQLVGLLPGM